jgi:hypothetical protein
MRRLVTLLSLLVVAPVIAQRAPISSKPDTPFKLTTFAAAGKTRVGMVVGTRVRRKPPEFLKPGDVVTIDIDGIGTLTTPMKAATAGGTQ